LLMFLTNIYYQHVVVREHLLEYPTPVNFNYFWSFGSLAGIFLTVQLVSGILLAMYYTPHTFLAFISIEHIMRDVNYGWLIRYIHANGASFFFIVVYLHIAKALYYSSYIYPMENLWRIGVIIFILMMATAFMGYVLPWGQMSFWGATVITNLFTAIPLIGNKLVTLLWGGYSIDNPTLNRFFSLHYLLPFVIAGCVVLHLTLLHNVGSSHPIRIFNTHDKISFYPYFYYKDLFSLLVVFIFFFLFIFFFPNVLGHADNYIEANALVTPTHIVPEWYFLPFYAILRSIPDKLGGVICMGLALILLLFLPGFRYKNYLPFSPININPNFRPTHRVSFWIFVSVVLLLGWIGSKPVEAPYITIGQICTFFYFFYLICFIHWAYIFDFVIAYSFKANNQKQKN
jgi:ubiquinol-cytochrome c reductase cytochrome b subunit